MKHLIILLVAAMLIACNKSTTKPQSKKEVPVNGVDISHHNTVAWDSSAGNF
jgi:outer membrane biogenesis lipoprotein LolB